MNYKRIIEVICIIAFIVMCCSLVVKSVTPDRHEFEEVTYTVESGDCLWYIANDYCPDDMDKREYIQLIRERNGLTSSIIYPGQNLIVFVEK